MDEFHQRCSVHAFCTQVSQDTDLHCRFVVDPEKGPQTSGWKQYDPNDTTSIAILGKSLTGADPGDHVAIDSSCAYWNTILPLFPQVCRYLVTNVRAGRYVLMLFDVRRSPHAAPGHVNFG